MSIQNGSQLLNEVEAAALLGLSRKTLQGWRWKRTGPAWIKIGGRLIRYKLEDLESYLDGRTIQTRREA